MQTELSHMNSLDRIKSTLKKKILLNLKYHQQKISQIKGIECLKKNRKKKKSVSFGTT